MSRIIAGTAGGRRIETPPGAGTRPTTDRVREALFSRLEHLEVLEDAVVLDLYAGSGALGLEAASRGAAAVTLVEADRRAATVIRRNVADLGLRQCQVRAEPVERVLASAPSERTVELVLADPPYDVEETSLERVLALVVPWLVQDALLVIERSSRSPEPTWPADVELIGPRRYGETVMWFAEYLPEGEIA
ncbi:16S rRNA (guanine(966)-N(2))-methyltransferase RsmD [Luteipulveratus flavus]|uniref:16S rRNA (Guanine(966)-N(2))-methyltransferase RsmD n=1 Tax=Luteipulveratus flavus TaxID=3031728 RepID=A0ABT6C4H0_9MICO|nr:16S rRNA (guanine(966)-N(2))-methyltransferase RsmD [Luteipulveratus sp. YIM 133296]MDF8263782.1 16S rRNA (guanine(966)-N(2))-methyltransferase RsmD [Luteipulveratus sp. YIM 133296]